MLEIASHTGVTPPALQNKPELYQEAEFYFKAYMDLSGSRVHTFNGPATIPMTEIKAYADLYNLDLESIEILVQVVNSLDLVFLKKLGEDRKTTENSKT